MRAPRLDQVRYLAAIAFLMVALAQAVNADAPLQPLTIVVFNSSIPESVELAKFYAQKRGIARDHLVGLACSKEEEISREDYDRTIANPLREIFKKRSWWTLSGTGKSQAVSAMGIRFVALIKGMPLKIRPAENYPGDSKGSGPIGTRNEASVDSELSLLARFATTISGATTNPYFKSYRPIAEVNDVPVLLVCRLDAPDAATVRRMIVDAIETEKKGLWGRAFVDGWHNTSPGFEVGDQWLGEIVKQLRQTGVPVVYDDVSAVFPDGYPVSDCALYYGWYAAGVSGPFAPPTFRFLPGAIAVHIHSFSASSLRDPNAYWVAPLLTRGAAASVGNVYEPYLQLTNNLNILNDRLIHSFTFAEAAYMSIPALSWMSVMVGDPLYRPYLSWLQIDPKAAPEKANSEWVMYHDFAVQNASKQTAEFRTLGREAASRARNGAMIEDLGLMEMKDGNFPSANSHFLQARALYTKREDIVRTVIEEVDGWMKQENPKKAGDLLRSFQALIPDGPTKALLKKMEQDLSPSVSPVPKL
jgi:uncharacterized protein (TIGR03790 family)